MGGKDAKEPRGWIIGRILTADTKISPNEDPVHTGDMAGDKSFGL